MLPLNTVLTALMSFIHGLIEELKGPSIKVIILKNATEKKLFFNFTVYLLCPFRILYLRLYKGKVPQIISFIVFFCCIRLERKTQA
jgi:hypothetical protein